METSPSKKMTGGGLIQLVSIPVNDMFTGNPQVSYFAGGISKKLLHPELYHANLSQAFNPRTEDVKEFPKEKYCGEILFKYEEPILKPYGDSRFSNETDPFTPFKVRGYYLKDASPFNVGDLIEEVLPYEA
jgi:hypothetical protein